MTDLCYGFVAFRRSCLRYLELTSTGFEVETEMTLHALRAGLRIVEVPSIEMPRRHGVSNLRTFRDGQRVLRTIIREHRHGATEDQARTPGVA
nr:putative glycosyltransferase domain protein [uncultured bacterium]